jgi:hypothetical protein
MALAPIYQEPLTLLVGAENLLRAAPIAPVASSPRRKRSVRSGRREIRNAAARPPKENLPGADRCRPNEPISHLR